MTDAYTLQRTPTFILRSSRLILRPMTLDDTDDIYKQRCRGENRIYDKGPPDATPADTRSWMQSRVIDTRTVVNFVIELQDESAYIREPPVWSGGADAPLAAAEPSRDTLDTLPARVIGAIGVFNGPECGYMVHPAYQGKGYATEALRTLLKWYWGWWPRAPKENADKPSEESSVGGTEEDGKEKERARPWPQPADGSDYIRANTDPDNLASHGILNKCGFVPWSYTFEDFESTMLGTRDTLLFRLARPGTTLGPSPYETTEKAERERIFKERRDKAGKT